VTQLSLTHLAISKDSRAAQYIPVTTLLVQPGRSASDDTLIAGLGDNAASVPHIHNHDAAS
jgi:hypothetical protein